MRQRVAILTLGLVGFLALSGAAAAITCPIGFQICCQNGIPSCFPLGGKCFKGCVNGLADPDSAATAAEVSAESVEAFLAELAQAPEPPESR